MPIYEFVCQRCGHEFEQILSFSDTSVPACPACAGSQVERRLGRPAIHFKGSGWYITDSKSSKNAASKDRASAKEKNGDGPAAATTESSGEGKASAAGDASSGDASAGKKESAAAD